MTKSRRSKKELSRKWGKKTKPQEPRKSRQKYFPYLDDLPDYGLNLKSGFSLFKDNGYEDLYWEVV